ncbi:MAG: cell division protein ZapA [Gammaproteobacteria bacterium]|nr:cell division protein ZapA [Gammaproteobacteria bacterium]NIV44833.1 cell division protein ZapA [Candidatus Bathyarchaeota archaeon]
MRQSIQVSILGQQFNLRSDAPPEQVHRVARFVEDQISQVTKSGRAVDSLQAAILALLNVSAAHLDGSTTAETFAEEDQRLDRLVEKIEKALS